MRRRTLLAVSIPILIAAAASGVWLVRSSDRCSDGPAGTYEGRPCPSGPSFVVILTDDQRVEWMRALPNVRRLLGDNGYTFTNSFASTPLCCPSRATLLTGQTSRHSGVFDNVPPNGGFRAIDATATLATWLSARGYGTSFIGKYLNGYERLREPFAPPGWDDWHGYVQRGRGSFFDYDLYEDGARRRFGTDPADYLTDVMARRARSFIGSVGRPFFMVFAPLAPHFPAIPAPRDGDAFRDEPPFRPAAYDAPSRPDNPASRLPPLSAGERHEIDGYQSDALASLLAVDRAVADIVRAVDAAGRLDETVFVFTSDNGMMLGEHRIFSKIWAYEPSIRVPLLIRVPWQKEGVVDDRFVLNVDVAPTIAELAGIEAPIRADGQSLVPVLRGEQPAWRQEVRLEFFGSRRGQALVPPRYKAIRTDRYKLIVYEGGARELYDLQADPDELDDLAEDPRADATEAALFARLEEVDPGWPPLDRRADRR